MFFKRMGKKQCNKTIKRLWFLWRYRDKKPLDKALITISSHDHIEMHDLIQEMGREIVHEESIKNSRGQSRLWNFEEFRNLLENDKGTDAVEGIFLDMTETPNLYLSSHAFTKMPNLRLLSFSWRKYKETHNCVYLPTGLELLPNSLRYVDWDRYPLKSLPSTFSPENLVELFLVDNKVEKLWNGVQNLPNLESLYLQYSQHLTEVPDLSRAPNLKLVCLRGCSSLSHVHPSIFSLQKLEILLMDECEALKSLSISNLSASLQTLTVRNCSNLQEFSLKVDHYTGLLSLGHTAINELPSSILHFRNLSHFGFPISESLMDLPENFTHDLQLYDSRQHQHDALVVLRTLLQHSPGFQYVRCLSFNFCRTLSELPDNISLLSSLEELSLFRSHLISLPESIKCLPRLKLVDLRFSEKLQSLPALPQSIQSLQAGGCISLKAVSSLMSGSPQKHNCSFLFENCLELDQDAINTNLEDVLCRIEEAKPSSVTVFEDEKDGEICFCLPVDSIRVLDSWLHYYSRQAFLTIELHPNLKFFGFIFCLVVSQVPLLAMEVIENLGCESFLETSSGERVHITSFFMCAHNYDCQLIDVDERRLLSDHAYLWYDAKCCQQIMEVIKKSKAINDGNGNNTYNLKLTFEFFAVKYNDESVGIKECGLHLIYPSKDHMVEQGEGSKSKRSREIHELEEPIPASAIAIGVEGSEEHKDEQQEPLLHVPPTIEFRLIPTMRLLQVSLIVLLFAVFIGFLLTNSLQQRNSSHELPPT